MPASGTPSPLLTSHVGMYLLAWPNTSLCGQKGSRPSLKLEKTFPACL